MADTVNIGIGLMPTNPSAPETIYSQAMQRIDDSLTKVLSVDCTAGGDITLSQTNTQKYGGYTLTGTPAAGFNFVLDSSITGKAPFMIKNGSGKTATIKIGSASATVLVTNGAVTHCRVTDANSIYEVSASGGGTYTDEQAQDAIGAMVDATIVYVDATPSLGLSSNQKAATVQFQIDGGGSTITTGIKGYVEVPFNCTITRSTLLADQSGSIVVNIWKTTYSSFNATTHPAVGDKITASAPPTITTAVKAQDATLTGWTTSITAGDVLAFNVDSVTTIQRVTVSLLVNKT